MQSKDIEVAVIGKSPSVPDSSVSSDLPNLLDSRNGLKQRGRASFPKSMGFEDGQIARKSLQLQQQVHRRKSHAMNPQTGEIHTVMGGEEEPVLETLIQNPIELQVVMTFLKSRINVQNGFGEQTEKSVFTVLVRLWGLIMGIGNLSGAISIADHVVIPNSLGLSEAMPQSLNFTTDTIQVVFYLCLLFSIMKMHEGHEVTPRVFAGLLLMTLTGILAGTLNFAVRAVYVGNDGLTLGQSISRNFLEGDTTPLTITNMTKILSGISIVAHLLSHLIDMGEQRTVNKTLIAVSENIVMLKQRLGAKCALEEVVHSSISTILEGDKLDMKQELLAVIAIYDQGLGGEVLSEQTLDVIVDQIRRLMGFEKNKGRKFVLACLVDMALLAGILNINDFNKTSVSAVVASLHIVPAGARWIRSIKHAFASSSETASLTMDNTIDKD